MPLNPAQDENGTPHRGIYLDRLVDRQVSELLGLAKGIICDGVVNDAEVMAIRQWLVGNPDVTVSYPGNVLAERILAILDDAVVDDGERADLKNLLLDLVGEPHDLTGSMNETTRLLFDDPPPTLFFDGNEFVFTGVFAYGSREKCEREVKDRGGRVGKSITGRTTTLVVGLMPSPAWAQSTHGRKIEEAHAARRNGQAIHIVSEEHWIDALQIDAH